MGAPGSGKGTQAKLLADRVGGRVFTSGDEFRALAASQAYIGRRLKASLEAGELMPHWLASYVFEKVIFSLELEETIVFGGSVRTKPEAELFHEAMHWLGRPYVAIYLEASEDNVMRRLVERKAKEGRADDHSDTFHTRIDEFNTKTLPAIDYFRLRQTLVIVNGDQSIDETQGSVRQALGL